MAFPTIAPSLRLALLGVAALALVIAVVSLWPRSSGGGRPNRGVYYYDLGTGKVFVGGVAESSVTAPSGQGAVLARVFSCTDCGAEAARFVAYLETHSPDSPPPANPVAGSQGRRPTRPGAGGGRMRRDLKALGRVVAKPDLHPAWIDAASPEGEALVAAAVHCSGPGLPQPCRP